MRDVSRAVRWHTCRVAFGALAAFVAFPAVAMANPQIVIYKPGVDVAAKIKRQGVSATYVYQYAVNGFAGDLSSSQVTNVRKDPDVLMLAPDNGFSSSDPGNGKGSGNIKVNGLSLPEQVIPAGIRRTGATLSTTAAIDGVDDRVDADVAVLDTGIQPDHPDLNVVGGANCQGGRSWADGNDHGTHVAGTIGALDNGIGVVGMAPGARLWAVRVLNDAGTGNASSIICGIDWVTAHADTIHVANISIGGRGSDDGNCGRTNKDAIHLAICNSVAAGITYTVAAGNGAADGSNTAPGSYREVLGVSAYADFDGRPGGVGIPPTDCTIRSADDSMAFFSDFGPTVDIAAPGVCVLSTVRLGYYQYFSGTSMAAPHVAGAAALYLATHPYASPEGVRTALLAAGTPGPLTGDPDAYPEPLLCVIPE